MATLDDLDHILGLARFEDMEVLTQDGHWWRLDVEDSALARIIEQPVGQAVIGGGRAWSDDVSIRARFSEVIGGPFVLTLAMDADFGNHLAFAVATNHIELVRLFGEILASWLFCGHEYSFAGVGAVELP